MLHEHLNAAFRFLGLNRAFLLDEPGNQER
jgi:hypothetical protein